MRDPSLARILDAPHYKQGTKYKVWPGYDLAVVVMDTAEGITHSMRSKEYELRNELFFALLKDLGLRTPELVEFSRLNIKNAPISKRLLTPLVKEGKVLGWDDPRLPTLKGLARRGILPDAVKLFVLSFGLSKVESEPSWEALLVENRKLLDPVSKHYFFVPEPIKLNVAGASAKEVELKFHPKNDLGGKRKIHVSSSVYIPKKDFDLIKEGETFRLKDLYNAKMLKPTKGECEFAGDGLVEKKLQWVPASDGEFLECEVLAPKDLVDEDGNYRADSLDVIKGVCEKGCGELKVGEVIQFERFGFCRFDGKDGKKLRFVFSC
jgi:glutamyl-tRNA synthetase